MARRSPALMAAVAAVGLVAFSSVNPRDAVAAPLASATTPVPQGTATIWVPTIWSAPAFHAPFTWKAKQTAARRAAGLADAPAVDWRVLAGLDYLTGKVTDTLKALEGKEVKIPGFVVPLDDFEEEGAEFLLVPYYGACVHTPPPPPNQIVFVTMTGKKKVKLALFDAVWMHGKLKISSYESPYGTVGFQLEGTKMEPYSSQ